MEIHTKLPKTYRKTPIAYIETERSRILSKLIKIWSAMLTLLLFALGSLFMPLEQLTDMDDVFEHLVVVMLGMIAITILHEWFRAGAMWFFSGVKPVVHFAGMYPHAGCEAFFDRKSETAVCLIPLVLTLVITLIPMFLMPDASWMWMVWIIMTVGVCSGVSDVYMAIRMTKLPKEILVENVGATFLVFAPENV